MTMELGFNMAGTERKFEEMLNASRCSDTFRYLEIGVAHADTLIAVARWCNKNAGVGFSITGIDLIGCEYFDPKYFYDCCPEPFSLHVNRWQDIQVRHGVNLHLLPPGYKPRCGVNGNSLGIFDFCLIDGCHGRTCVMSDFHSIEPWIKPGGIVAFHDACEEDQGKDFQPHCQEPINVRTALKHMGLLDNTRAGWGTAGEVHGDKSRQGNGFAFFRRLP